MTTINIMSLSLVDEYTKPINEFLRINGVITNAFSKKIFHIEEHKDKSINPNIADCGKLFATRYTAKVVDKQLVFTLIGKKISEKALFTSIDAIQNLLYSFVLEKHNRTLILKDTTIVFQ